MPSNDDDRRQWRKQGGVVGAAASKTRVPLMARSGCWVPQPVEAEGIQNRFYFPIPASCSYSCAAPPPGYFTLTKALFRMHTPSEYTVSRNFWFSASS